MRLKALSVRFWGIPEGGLKALKIKGYLSLRGAKRRGNLITPSLFLFPSSNSHEGEIYYTTMTGLLSHCQGVSASFAIFRIASYVSVFPLNRKTSKNIILDINSLMLYTY